MWVVFVIRKNDSWMSLLIQTKVNMGIYMKKNILLSVLLACTSMSIWAQSLNDSSSPSVNKAHSNVEHSVNLYATNSQTTNNSASSNVADNGVSIIEAKGWLESVYVKWMPLE